MKELENHFNKVEEDIDFVGKNFKKYEKAFNN